MYENAAHFHTTTQQPQLPRHSAVGALLLAAGREATNGAVTPAPKFPPPSHPD
jgi:hypothetical protein